MDKDEEYIVNQKTGSLEESSIYSLIINFLWGHRLLSFILPTLINWLSIAAPSNVLTVLI